MSTRILVLTFFLFASLTEAAQITVTKTFDDLHYNWADARVFSDGANNPLVHGKIGDETGIAGFDEGTYGDLTRVDVSFQYQLETRWFAQVTGGIGSASANTRMDERFYVGTNGASAPLLVEIVNTTIESASCTATTTAGCLDYQVGSIGPATAYEYSFTGEDADYFLDTVFIGTVLDIYLENIVASSTGEYSVAGGTRAFEDDRLFEANLAVTYTYGVVPVPAAAWLFGSALGLLGWMRRKRA